MYNKNNVLKLIEDKVKPNEYPANNTEFIRECVHYANRFSKEVNTNGFKEIAIQKYNKLVELGAPTFIQLNFLVGIRAIEEAEKCQ